MRIFRCLVAAFCMMLCLASFGKGKAEIPILAWYSIPTTEMTEERYLELKEAGFTISYSSIFSLEDALKALELGDKTGVKVLIYCRELFSDPENAVRELMAHPSLFGYSLGDEPSYKDFPTFAAAAERIRAIDSEHMLYMNLFPNYAPVGLLCSYEASDPLAGPYADYVRNFAEQVKLPMLSFDHYPVTSGGVRREWWSNLEVVSRQAEVSGVPFWAFTLATAHDPYPVATMASMRLQLYTDLAYGAQGLQYFTYWCPESTVWNFHEAPIDLEGNKTQVYYLAKELNAEIQARADVFLGSKVLKVRHTGLSLPPGVTPLSEIPAPVTKFDTHGKGAVVSLLEKGKYHYMVVVNRSVDEAWDYDIEFSARADRIGRDGKPSRIKAGKPLTFNLEEGDCAIYRWKAKYSKP